jgi:putative polyketide hydroxylase
MTDNDTVKPAQRTQVLILGGSLNGLTSAVLLANFGVRCIVIERHSETTAQYKFAGISPRSMEICRSAGVEDEIRTKRTGDQKSGEIARGRNLSDPDIKFMGKAWAATPDLSACSAETCDQERLEPILRTHAERLGADVRFTTELIGFEQDEHEVRARVRNLATGSSEVITASYLVAADGVAGKTREKLGIERHGPGFLQHWMNIIFETDLEPYLQEKLFTSCFVTDINGTLTPP